MRVGGVYAITDASCCGPGGLLRVEVALEAGIDMLQVRCKDGMSLDGARALVALARSFHIPVIVNDDVALAHAAGADGVHLGQDDADLALARAVLGPQALIGVSCYASLDRARRLASQGADYLAFGSFFPSRTKPAAVRASPDILRAAGRLGRPLVAIGGILPENGGGLLTAGASALAVIDGIFGQHDIRSAVSAYKQLFEERI